MNQPTHLTEEQFSRLWDRTLEPAEVLAADLHLEACGECRERLYRESGAAGAVRRVQGGLNATPRAVRQIPVRKARTRIAVYAAIGSGLLLFGGLALRALRPESFTDPAPRMAGTTKRAEPALSPEEQDAIQSTLSTRSMERAPVLDRLITKRGVLLGAADEQKSFAVKAPVGTTVLNDRPLFRWEAVAGASSYVVAIFDENFGKVAESPELTAEEWRPEKPLAREKMYNWQVTAHVGGKTLRSPVLPAPEARFEIAGAEVANQFEKARREHPENHLLLAVLLAKAGALDGVEAEVDALAATDASTARALLASVKRFREQ